MPAKTTETTRPIRTPDPTVETTLTPIVVLTRKYAGTPRTNVTAAATGTPPIEIRTNRTRLLPGVFRFEESVATIEAVNRAAWSTLATNAVAAKAGLTLFKGDDIRP